MAISADGTQVLLGAPARQEIGTAGYGTGAAFLWTLGSNTTWSEANIITPATTNATGDLGYTVALPNNGAQAMLGDPYFGNRSSSFWVTDARKPRASLPRSSSSKIGGVYHVQISLMPHIQSVAPSLSSPGQVVQVQGTGFAGASVTFDGRQVTTLTHTATKVTFRLPATAYSDTVSIARSGSGLGAGAAMNVRPPVVTGISPNPARRGSRLTLTGTDLTSIVNIWVGRNFSKARIVSESATKLVLIVPSHAITGTLLLATRAIQFQTAKVTFN